MSHHYMLTPEVPQISYATFKRYLQEDKVEQVVISETLIRGTLKPGVVEEGTTRGGYHQDVEGLRGRAGPLHAGVRGRYALQRRQRC